MAFRRKENPFFKKEPANNREARELFPNGSGVSYSLASSSRSTTSGNDDGKSGIWDPTFLNRHRTRRLSSGSNSSSSSVADSSILMTVSEIGGPTSKTKRSTQDDFEEGEFSDSGSLQEEFNDGYDEEFMGDEEDRQRISLMSEREREEVIYDRMERREKLWKRFEIQKKLRDEKKLNASNKNISEKDKNLSLCRMRTIECRRRDPKSAAMDELMAKREDRRLRAEEKRKIVVESPRDEPLKSSWWKESSHAPAENKLKLHADEVYSSSSDSDSEDDLWKDSSLLKVSRASESSSKSQPESERSADLCRRDSQVVRSVTTVKQLQRIQMTRDRCEKWVHLPFFTKLIVGCFVKLGFSGKAGSYVYRICQVKEVVEGQSYTLNNTRTTKSVRVQHGSDQKLFDLHWLSNKEFTQEEFQRWKTEMDGLRMALPTMDFVDAKEREFRAAQNYQFKDEDINEILREKQKLGLFRVNFALQKTILMKDREEALRFGNEMRVLELDREIRELDEKSRQGDKVRNNSLAKISVINERNRKRNREIMETAILESQEDKDGDGKRSEDPFTRRVTKPSRPTMRKEIQISTPDSPTIPAPVEVQVEPPVIPDVVAHSSVREELEIPAEDSSEDEQAPQIPNNGLVAMSNDGERYTWPLDPSIVHSHPHMTYFNRDYTEEMFNLHDFEVILDEEDFHERVKWTKPGFHFPSQHQNNPYEEAHAAMFSLDATVVPTNYVPKKKITLEEYRRRRSGM